MLLRALIFISTHSFWWSPHQVGQEKSQVDPKMDRPSRVERKGGKKMLLPRMRISRIVLRNNWCIWWNFSTALARARLLLMLSLIPPSLVRKKVTNNDSNGDVHFGLEAASAAILRAQGGSFCFIKLQGLTFMVVKSLNPPKQYHKLLLDIPSPALF